jgi:hypothetical protein
MKFANATNLYRKSGKAQPTCPGVPWRDLRFRRPLLETRMTNGRLAFPRGFGDDWWRLWAGRTRAHEWRTADPSASNRLFGQIVAINRG